MTLPVGTRLGPYEVVGPLGAGGMGEVYRASDTRLGRSVAIKVLPEHLAESPQARERFEREARAISALGHPSICTLYDIGTESGRGYLVMELVEGETLAARLERGQLAPAEALRVAIQVADGLAAAHRQGIVHRDLKPANVMLTRTGAKILDFGVAKLREDAAEDAGGASAPTILPTRTTPLTSQGTLIGTMQYMSPEQLEAKPVDHRADVFAFGATLYEMLTGKRAFSGTSQASLIAAILEREPPPVSQLVPTSPPALDRAIRRCLAKDPDERWQSMLDLRAELEWIASGGASALPVAADTAPRRRPTWLRATAALVGAAALVALGSVLDRPATTVAHVTRTTILLPAATELDVENGAIALSPDGTKLAYTASMRGEPRRLWIRPLDSLTPQALAGTEGATYPFWSPDGSQLGFFAERKLRKVPAAGGIVQAIADAPAGRGGAWSTSGVIVFAPDARGPLWQVPAAGGTAVQLTSANETQLSHRNPRFLPDGKRVLFFAGYIGDKGNGVYSVDVASGETSLVLAGDTDGTYAEPGYLVFVRAGNLMAQRFDPATLRLSGEALPVVEDVQFNPFRYTGTYTVSGTGMLLYHAGPVQGSNQLTWYDLEGKPQGTVGDPAVFWFTLRISPDGKKALATVRRGADGSHLWIYDLVRNIGRRFTTGEANSLNPVWSPDGRRVAYTDGTGGVFIRSVDGTSPPERIDPKGRRFLCTTWSPDDAVLGCFEEQNQNTGSDLWMLPLRGEGEPAPWIVTNADELYPDFSPDGRWVAYLSDESGRQEVYVASYPDAGGKWQVSNGGASFGRFTADARAIVYADNEGRMFSVPVEAGPSGLEIGAPSALFGGVVLPVVAGEFAPDGKRFLGAARVAGDAAPELTLVTNWSAGY